MSFFKNLNRLTQDVTKVALNIENDAGPEKSPTYHRGGILLDHNPDPYWGPFDGHLSVFQVQYRFGVSVQKMIRPCAAKEEIGLRLLVNPEKSHLVAERHDYINPSTNYLNINDYLLTRMVISGYVSHLLPLCRSESPLSGGYDTTGITDMGIEPYNRE
jgi:hypothetical protein